MCEIVKQYVGHSIAAAQEAPAEIPLMPIQTHYTSQLFRRETGSPGCSRVDMICEFVNSEVSTVFSFL